MLTVFGPNASAEPRLKHERCVQRTGRLSLDTLTSLSWVCPDPASVRSSLGEFV